MLNIKQYLLYNKAYKVFFLLAHYTVLFRKNIAPVYFLPFGSYQQWANLFFGEFKTEKILIYNSNCIVATFLCFSEFQTG